MSATEVLKLLKDEKINVVTYARHLLDRIDKRDSIVKAWAYLGDIDVFKNPRINTPLSIRFRLCVGSSKSPRLGSKGKKRGLAWTSGRRQGRDEHQG
jgi:hypothetical protein